MGKKCKSQRGSQHSHIWKDELTSEHWYWLGFILADGCIIKERTYYRFQIKLKQEDEQHLVKFNKFIGRDGITYETAKLNGNEYKQCRVRFTDTDFCEGLMDLGIMPRKSKEIYTLVTPPSCFAKDFIRGYVDGDGHIGIRYNKYLRVSVIGQLSICKYIYEYFNCGSLMHYTGGKSKDIYIWETTSVHPEVLAKIYKDATIFLSRKKEVFDKYCNEYIQRFKAKLNTNKQALIKCPQCNNDFSPIGRHLFSDNLNFCSNNCRSKYSSNQPSSVVIC